MRERLETQEKKAAAARRACSKRATPVRKNARTCARASEVRGFVVCLCDFPPPPPPPPPPPRALALARHIFNASVSLPELPMLTHSHRRSYSARIITHNSPHAAGKREFSRERRLSMSVICLRKCATTRQSRSSRSGARLTSSPKKRDYRRRLRRSSGLSCEKTRHCCQMPSEQSRRSSKSYSLTTRDVTRPWRTL